MRHSTFLISRRQLRKEGFCQYVEADVIPCGTPNYDSRRAARHFNAGEASGFPGCQAKSSNSSLERIAEVALGLPFALRSLKGSGASASGAGMLAVRFRLLSVPPCGRCFQNRLPLHHCKRDLALPHSFGVLKMLQPRGRRTLNICKAKARWLGTLAPSQEQKSSLEGTEQFRLIYRFPAIRYCRVLSRLKLLQTALTVLILPPVWVLYWQNQVPPSLCLYCTGIACFAAAMLYGMSFYLRRIIGMMYLSKDGTMLKVSHLTFWGKRKDIYCPVETVMTLGDIGEDGNDLLLRFQQYDREAFLYFSLRLGKIVDPEGFAKVFGQTE